VRRAWSLFVFIGLSMALPGCAGKTGAKPGVEARPTSSSSVPDAHSATSDGVRLYTDGKIYTATSDHRFVDAIAVRGIEIVGVGDAASLLARFPTARRVSLRQRTVVPGFNDAHRHTEIVPPNGMTLKFASRDPSTGDLREAVTAATRTLPSGQWIFGKVGPSVLSDDAVNRTALDAIASAHPLVLSAFWGHGYVMNSRALEALGVADSMPDPPGGRFKRNAQGALEGHASEYAGWLVARRMSKLVGVPAIAEGQQKMFVESLGFGITSIQLMSWFPSGPYLRLVRDASKRPRIRWINLPLPDGEPPVSIPGARTSTFSAHGLKWLLDGTPLEHGEELSSPYADGQPATRGNFSQEEVGRFFGIAVRAKQQVLMHAVGGSAADEIIRETERLSADDRASVRPRIEHGDWLQPEQIARVASLGIVVVQNPIHFDGVMVPLLDSRRGKARQSMRLKSLAEKGIHVAIGSDDGPLNPWVNLKVAITHPYWPAEAMSREQAVDAYTRESAYAEQADSYRGTLEAGKIADFAVLSQDVFTCPVDALPATRSLMTVVGGQVVSGAEGDL
jgi:predicted amidohydrolase YtcJ